MGQGINLGLLRNGMKDHVSIAREKAGIEETAIIELWYLSENEEVRDGLNGLFADATFNRESRIANTWDASEWTPPQDIGEGWGFPLGGHDITLWVTEHSPSRPV